MGCLVKRFGGECFEMGWCGWNRMGSARCLEGRSLGVGVRRWKKLLEGERKAWNHLGGG